MWNLILVRLETVLVSVQDSARFVPNIPWAHTFWTHLVVLLGDEDQVVARFYPLRDSANLDSR
jgi:hypothetical protein